MLNERFVSGATIIAQNTPAEQPLNGYIRVVADQKEFLLGEFQTKIWRKIGENEQLDVNELYLQLNADGTEINLEDLSEIVSQFLRFGLVVEREELW
jgi:hypothetical protein